MKLAIFGGTGQTGVHVVQQALAAGHQVQALVRTPSKMPIQHPNLTLIQGDAMNSDAVNQTIGGTKAVINTLGHVKGSPDNLQVTVITNILNTMQASGVKRLVTLSGGGVGFEGDKPKFVDYFFKFLLSVLSPKVLRDGEAHVEILKKSDLDWVVVRAPRLTNAPHTGQYKVGIIGDEGMSTQLGRADVADFMLKQLTDGKWLRRAPFISQ